MESFNGKFRDEFLNGEIFYTLREAKVLIEGWRQEYNKVRPHSALGYRPPAPGSDPAVTAGFRSAPPGGNGVWTNMEGGPITGGRSTLIAKCTEAFRALPLPHFFLRTDSFFQHPHLTQKAGRYSSANHEHALNVLASMSPEHV